MTDLAKLRRVVLDLKTLPEFLRQYPSLAIKLREVLEPKEKPADPPSEGRIERFAARRPCASGLHDI
jgi:hypothetical protein